MATLKGPCVKFGYLWYIDALDERVKCTCMGKLSVHVFLVDSVGLGQNS